MRAVMTPVATPRAKDPLKTPRKMPKDFNKAMASKLWLLSPAGWYATMELQDGHIDTQVQTFRHTVELGFTVNKRSRIIPIFRSLFFIPSKAASHD